MPKKELSIIPIEELEIPLKPSKDEISQLKLKYVDNLIEYKRQFKIWLDRKREAQGHLMSLGRKLNDTEDKLIEVDDKFRLIKK